MYGNVVTRSPLRDKENSRLPNVNWNAFADNGLFIWPLTLFANYLG